jgi:hypothetical protein
MMSKYASDDEEDENYRDERRFPSSTNDNDMAHDHHSPVKKSDSRNDDRSPKRPRFYADDRGDSRSQAASRVIFVRQLPSSVEVHDLEYLTQAVGGCTEVVLLRNKLQAFIEFMDIETATKFLDHYKGGEVAVR